jgi:CheY-like chemotaxis protein
MAAAQAIDVLLIEDDPGDALITRESLEQNDIQHTLNVTRDGREGLDYLHRRGGFQNAARPDLILLDLNLPIVSGLEVLQAIKAAPELCDIPVVVLSTSAADEDVLSSYRLQANAYVTKPVDLENFMAAVRRIDEFFFRVVKLPPRQNS